MTGAEVMRLEPTRFLVQCHPCADRRTKPASARSNRLWLLTLFCTLGTLN
jgi:hypothetical protein